MQVQPKTANVLALSENLIKTDDWLKVSAATTLVLNQPIGGLNVITQNRGQLQTVMGMVKNSKYLGFKRK